MVKRRVTCVSVGQSVGRSDVRTDSATVGRFVQTCVTFRLASVQLRRVSVARAEGLTEGRSD